MAEEWRACVNEPGYEVSNLGRVRSVDRVVQTVRGPRQYRGQTLRPGRAASGHMTVMCGRKIGSRHVHQLVLEAFVGPRPEGQEGLHGPRGVANNELTNLAYGTRSQNLRDFARDGLRKLTLEQVDEARAASKSGVTGRALAARYGVCESNMSYILREVYYGS